MLLLTPLALEQKKGWISKGRLRATILKSAEPAHLLASSRCTASADLKMVARNHLLIIGNPKSACLQFYTAKTQAALGLPFLPYSTLRVEQCFDSGCLYCSGVEEGVIDMVAKWRSPCLCCDNNRALESFKNLRVSERRNELTNCKILIYYDSNNRTKFFSHNTKLFAIH